ncbi:PTS system, IIA component [Lacticaseibacillus casei A2-362]|nr:PTS system, IIA component [Lacticaseibacillus casei A2-362]
MLGFVVATHGALSDGLIDAAKLIVGNVDNTVTVNLNLGDDIDALNQKIADSITQVDKDDGVIVFTDLFGASPYNQSVLAISKLPKAQQKKIYLLTGVSLPMFIEAVNQQMIDANIDDAVENILNQANDGVTKWSSNDIDDVEASNDDDF